MGKRCICIALVLILFTTIGLAPLAQPAEAVAGVVVAGAVVAVMAMAGITIVTSGMTAAQIQDWVEAKLEEWATDVGSPLDHLINSAGIGVTISGLLTIGTAAAQGINQFITWLRAEYSLSDNSSLQVNSSYVIVPRNSNASLFVGTSNGNDVFFSSSNNNTRAAIVYSNNMWLYTLFSASPFTAYFRLSNGSVNSGYCKSGTPYYYYTYSYYSNIDNTILPLYSSLNNAWNDVETSLSIDTGVITPPQVINEEKVFVDVGALPGSTAQEVTEGVFTDVAADTLEVSGTVAEEEPEYIITGPVSVSGLDDIFPFCIPFDLYHMLEALAAEPVAPYFEWRFYVPRIIDYMIVIDLSGFNTVAQILRVMETLLFCVGLAFETRKLIRS